MEVTEEQRKRAKANRLAALAKRQAAAAAGKTHDSTGLSAKQPVPWQLNNEHQRQANNRPWSLFPCRKIVNQMDTKNVSEQPAFKMSVVVVLELCTANAFSVSVQPPSDSSLTIHDCFARLQACLLPVRQIQCTKFNDEGRPIYFLKDYELVLKTLKKFPDIRLQQIPWTTLAVVRKCSLSSTNGEWVPCMPNHLSDDEVDKLLENLPRKLKEELLPFQMDGVRFGLRRGGRCLIADEMGVGKTIQAIAIASCYMHEGSILVVCPASMRFTWAEELERWLPFCSPIDVHLVFGHRNNLGGFEKCPKIVVTSYTMLSRLRKSMLALKWGLMIVDESHNLRCTKKMTECEETKAVLDVARAVKHIVLLSGTPSVSRPGLLGKDKYDFAQNYCSLQSVQGSQGKSYKDFSKGIRLQELNLLLRETIMVRRLKQNVLAQLPPKRRQVIRLMLSLSDISAARASTTQDDSKGKESLCKCGFTAKGSCECEDNDSEDASVEFDISDELQGIKWEKKSARNLSYQEIGLAKMRSFQEWLFNHPIFADTGDTDFVDKGIATQKMVVFGHHLRVLDKIQEAVCERGLEFVRIDGSTLSKDRQTAVQAFRSRPEVKIAIIGITAGGVGLDFSSAQSIAFVELPKSASEMVQAEDRAHRRGQVDAVNIYIFCAKGTSDESQWQTLNKSLERISTMMNGIDAAIPEIEVVGVYDLDQADKTLCVGNMFSKGDEGHEYLESTITVSSRENDTTAEGNNTRELLKSSLNNGNIQPDDRCFPVLKQVQHGLIGDDRGGGTCDFSPESLLFEVDGVYDLDQADKTLCVGNMFNKGDEGYEYLESTITVSSKENDTTAEGNNTRELLKSSLNNGNIQPDDRCFPVLKQVQHGLIGDDRGGGTCDFPPESLLFEVSPNTGRIHLYVCVFNKDLRPRQLQENFRPEDLESVFLSDSKVKSSLPRCMHESTAHREVAVAFVKEWNGLRPIERNKLFGRPLRLPLCLELSCIKAEPHYTFEGLLQAGSKRRVAPKDETSFSLPKHASWRKICLRKHYKIKERHEMQAWTAEGEPLCKFCQNPCLGIQAKTPEYFEDLFCKLSCFEEYRMRTSQQALREGIFSIEHGICTQCKLDCHKLVKCIRPLSVDQRREHILKAAPDFAKHQRLFDKLALEPAEGNAWHADHIVPVYKGGGECRLENMRTLCVICHSKVTAEQQRDRRLTRAKAKEALQITIEKLIERVCKKRMKLYSQEHPCLQVEDSTETEDDKDLLVDVSGSAYSETTSQQSALNNSSEIGDHQLVAGMKVSKKLTLSNETNLEISSSKVADADTSSP